METVPRRIQLDLNLPAELAIRTAIDEVEKLGADENLSSAVILLAQAQNIVSTFIDNNLNGEK